jgi:hypothetical protein
MEKAMFGSVTLMCICLQLNLFAQNLLPSQRPTDFTLKAKYDGGVRYAFTELYISADSCYYRKNEKGKKAEKHFKLSDSQLDAIYSSLRKNQLNELLTEMTQKAVYDRGGTQMAFAWHQATQMFEVNDAYNSFIKPEWQAPWQAFQADLNNIIKKKIKRKRFWII